MPCSTEIHSAVACVHPGGRPRSGFTLLEILIAVGIILTLVAIAMPIAGIIREKAARTESRQMVSALVMALDTYAQHDRRHRFPLHEQLYPSPSLTLPHVISDKPVGGATVGVLALLIDMGVAPSSARHLDASGSMLDPWGRTYHYQLTRPAPASPASALQDWNWDAAAARAKAWDERNNAAAPYPYVWSEGKTANLNDASGWIYDAQR